MYKQFIKPILFHLDPEKAHNLAFSLLKILKYIPATQKLIRKKYNPQSNKKQNLKRTIWGLQFEHPIGLAAGFDKDANCIDELSCFGFSFIEIGTLTPKPQIGNPKKRLFRLPKDRAIINRMGFNNQGVNAAYNRLKHKKSNIIIGGNIGKNKDTSNENAIDDYLYSFRKLHEVVDYFVVNVSSPNTPGIRDLQEKKPLLHLLTTLQKENKLFEHTKPILLKIAPDLNEHQIDDIAELVQKINLDGLVISNTTIGRARLVSDNNTIKEIGNGGLSGKPISKMSTQMVKNIRLKVGKNFTIIAVGGVFSTKDAQEKIDAGANLVQVYTGFIYEGPSIVKNIVRGLK